MARFVNVTSRNNYHLTPLLFFLNNRFESIGQIARSKLHPIVIPCGDFLQSAKISSFCYFFTSITSKYFFSSALQITVYVTIIRENKFRMSNINNPYLGSRISLISKAKIRYEGILYAIDTDAMTVALTKVRSFGTENRCPDRPIAPRDETFGKLFGQETINVPRTRIIWSFRVHHLPWY